MKNIYLDIKKLKKEINLGFFTSQGGISKSNYKSLNCNKNNNDDNKKNVRENLKIAKEKLNLKNKRLKLINQIHSNKIIKINNKNLNNYHYGDGLVTSDREIALGILTADCAPIFIYDIKKKLICCLHSGWKGALNNIVSKGIKIFKIKKIKNNNIVVVVGPCLAFNNFEVDKNFKNRFVKKNHKYIKFFKTKNENKDLFNLRGLINYQIMTEKIKNVYNISKDTYKNSDIFFSNRRSKHQKNGQTGRMINIISFKT
tara:strand:- start:1785 stop:2555 length:771 start_codon:yes stop_codon:yes gene_type:complete